MWNRTPCATAVLVTSLQAQREAAASEPPLTAEKEEEHFASLGATLASLHTAQQDLRTTMQQQGDTLVEKIICGEDEYAPAPAKGAHNFEE